MPALSSIVRCRVKVNVILGFVASILAGVLVAATPRSDNISDEEVSNIVSVIQAESAGDIISIGPVTLGCPCAEGSNCTQSVTVLVEKNGHVERVRLSKIASRWQIGPLMRRQLEFAKADAAIRAAPPSTESRRRLAQLHFEERKSASAIVPCKAPN